MLGRCVYRKHFGTFGLTPFKPLAFPRNPILFSKARTTITLQQSRNINSPTSKNITPKDDQPLPIALPPTKRLAIVTCMDARIDPIAQLGIKEGEAHIIRNAGGMAKDALRSIIISQRLLGTREIAIYHHTGCGMVTFSTPTLRDCIKKADPGSVAVAKEVDAIDFLEFGDLEDSVRSDVNFLNENPLVLKGTKITGWIYDVDTRKATQVV